MPLARVARFRDTHIPKGSFRANVLTFMTGTVIAQCITVAVSPILTRLFTPEAFGAFGVYVSLVSMLVAASTLRYEQALVLPREHKDAAHLFWAALLSVTGVSAVSFFLCVLFHDAIIAALKVPGLRGWILLAPLSVFLGGVYSTLSSWSTRQKQFRRAALSQVVRSVAVSGVQVSSGVAQAGSPGLIGGFVSGGLFASLALAYQVRCDDAQILKEGLHWGSVKRLGKEYAEFPLYGNTQNVLNAISQNIPVLLLARFFGPTVAGLYAMGVRVIQLPMNLILTSLRQVLFQKASEVYNARGDTYALFKKTTLGLVAIGIVPTLIVILFGPSIFGVVLGDEWTAAGGYARWLVLWLACWFINLPAVLFGQICRKQKAFFLQDSALLVSRAGAVVIGGIRRDPALAIMLYSLVGVFFNVLTVGWMGGVLRRHRAGCGGSR